MKKQDKTASLKREFNNLLADIDSLLRESANLTGDEFAEAREKLQEKIEEVKSATFEIGGNISKGAQKKAAEANEKIHEEPWMAIGVGAAAGLLLGVLVARR